MLFNTKHFVKELTICPNDNDHHILKGRFRHNCLITQSVLLRDKVSE